MLKYFAVRKCYQTSFIILVIVSVIFTHIVLNMNSWTWILLKLEDKSNFKDEVAYSEMCPFYYLDPWNGAALKYYKKLPPIKCDTVNPDLAYVNDSGWLLLNDMEMKKQKLMLKKCKYRYILFSGSRKYESNYSSWYMFNDNKVKLLHDFVEVRCEKPSNWQQYYVNIYLTVVEQTSVLRKSQNRDLIDIFILVIDSVSRSSFIRNMPLLSQVLKENYKTISFTEYNRVGKTSYPNGRAFLMGNASDAGLENGLIENYPFIFRNFIENGYATLIAEELPSYSLFANTFTEGFQAQPTTHYYKQFAMRYDEPDLRDIKRYKCIGNVPLYTAFLNYTKMFLKRYSNEIPTFSLAWTSEYSHNDFNEPQVIDVDFAKFFSEIADLMNNSVIFVMGDHGLRFGNYRKTYFGELEENNPAFMVSLPNHIAETHPNLVRRLETNAKKLTTHFDLYATLKQLTVNPRWDELEKMSSVEQYQMNFPLPAALSLFRPMPFGRSCKEAGIPMEFCNCVLREKVVNIEDKNLIRRSSDIIVKRINEISWAVHPQKCAFLKLNRTLYARSGLNRNSLNSCNYVIIVAVETMPGGGQFESHIKVSSSEKDLKLVGSMRRINRYGTQSACVKKSEAQSYCYCLDYIADDDQD